ncbi:hypothetical protein [Streptomyces sp. NPDC051572]|uniref:hypothetical protein n=1 Tax=Streptomyces sp. NPDC051572 TaxID=3155802 RepID=UPI00344C9717
MGNNAEIRRVDREIVTATAKLEAVKRGEWWPLTGSEKRKVFGALASGSGSVVRGNSPSRAESKLERLSQQIETRLQTELSALNTVRETLVREDAKAKAKDVAAGKKSSSWW